MDVIIKSFNRPYYLQRCIYSIHKHLKGSYKITVLDDGTPPQYLDKIQKLFPEIQIARSNLYEQKTEAIATHLAGRQSYFLRSIPVKFWRDHISAASEIFLLLEEDAWLTTSLELNGISETMTTNNIHILKLYWGSNPGIVKGRKIPIAENLEEIIPDLPITNTLLADILLRDTLRIRSLMIKSGVIKTKLLLPYYALYTVSSAFFKKAYWMELWKNADDQVAEGRQLYEALQWKKKTQAKYAKTKDEYVDTSYITSCVNPFKIIDFDFIRFNHIMNETWLHGHLDSLQNYPRDFAVSYLKQFLYAAGADPSFIEWQRWISLFKGQYERMGSKFNY